MVTLQPIEPHTAAKHILLKRYLDAWFPILGSKHNRINYLDGFAGCGEYQGGHDGSPIIAIRSALAHVESGTLPPNVAINIILVEANKENLDHLLSRIEHLSLPKSFQIRAFCAEFRDVAESILDSFEKDSRSLAPTFAFVDPFGFKGIPMSIMHRILSQPRCEVFVNVMVEFINRFLEHPDEKITIHPAEAFGTDEVLAIAKAGGDRKNALIELYRKQLAQAAEFVGRFDMKSQRDRTIYSLFFASNSELGFVKMKNAMWRVDKSSGEMFSDADPSGNIMFDLFGTDPLWHKVAERFTGQLVEMSALLAFVRRETDFLEEHLRDHLRSEEKSGAIQVEVVEGMKRRAGTFPPQKVRIRFR